MLALRRPTFWRTLRRRGAVAVALLAYLAATFGFPLPAAPVHKGASQPFPCQDHPCGCRTAEECWRHCCCFTPEERWAWARAHNVKPPPYAEKPAAEGWNDAPLRAQPKTEDRAKRSCCASRHQQPESKPSCAACSRKPVSSERDNTPAASVKRGFRVVLGMGALRCRGLTAPWMSAGNTLPPPPPLTWTPWLVPTFRLTCCDDVAPRPTRTPPEPPPRPHHV